ncbi:hypothetical protein YTCETSXE_CDS0015 [Staphylococcus phage MVC_VPHSA2]|uniref:Transposase n=1 Tax=Staphylococcus phage MVC_VPHSA1 TaxID=3088876 RepID=A0ABZ0QYI8_9CAUD|nr:hypothetical protein FBHYGVHD_CDS0016 [Staphylococcus phage MVC_VPHSA1]WPF64971.1 hypothetical protein YTCETSXE_CDS0015 [Staphylococcus phage MVC_VPHSA2]
MIQLKERAIEILTSTNRFTLLEKTKMLYSLVLCVYYELRGRKTTNKLLQAGYDAMYLAHWVNHKRIFYKVTK